MTKTIRKRNKLGQFTKASPWDNIAFIKKATSILLMTLILVGFLGIKETKSYYNDTETSNGNYFSTGLLDFILTNNNLEEIIGPEALGEISHASVAMPVDDSLPMQYDVSTSIDTTTSNSAFCTGLIVEAKLNGITKYNGSLPGLANAVTTEFGTWEFRFDLPPTVSIPNNVKCNASVLFSAWREDIVNKADSSWHDEEILNISLTSRMVVLNEIYARPNSTVAPKDREYIELYNNSNAPVDVLGWKISEIAGTTETFYTVVASGALPSQVQPYNGAPTIIPAGGFLVLEFGGSASHLNDGGDTVKLYDNTTTQLDSHAYPTIPAGKAVMRFPDGIGFWVDPEATPGAENMVSMEDLKAAGFDEETIAIIFELMAIKNVSLLNDTDEIVPEPVVEKPILPETVLEVIPKVIAEIPQALEPEEIVTQESEVIEAPISEVIEPVSLPSPEVVTGEPEVEEEVVEVVPDVIETEEPTVAKAVEEVPAVVSDIVSE